ncbi:hypothetical protein Tsubulata_018781 [Turnera subulata]|uniref:Uncharacterized protein n=1 Tax=Turnera subulata TaxID=218843 RepID=A0A9Q0J8N3_9ROSI|nr:hypothetical protein Tsubulata_018781 [Turnera subulata]
MGGISLLSLGGVIEKHFFLATLAPPPLSPSYTPLNAISSSSSSTTTTTTTPTLSYGERYLVDSCGLSLESAVSVSKKLQLLHGIGIGDPRPVIKCFKAYGFADTHIGKVMGKYPKLLRGRVEPTLRPKLDYLIQIGFVGQLLPDLISQDPFILHRSLDRLKARHRLLWPYLGSEERFIKGVPHSCVGTLIFVQPTAITRSPERLASIVSTVKCIGIGPPSSPKFIHGVAALSRLSESSWNKRIELFKSFGWSGEEIWSACRRLPYIISLSDEKMTNNLNFCMDTIKLERQDLITNPLLLSFSLEGRIRPRWNVLQVLKSNNLVGEDISVVWALSMSDKSFLQRYVTSYADKIPELLEMYPESAASVSKKLKLLHGIGLGDPQPVIKCLKAYGFTDTHIGKVIEKYPKLLRGRDPFILNSSLDHLKARHCLLWPYFGSEEGLVKGLFRYLWLFSRSFQKSLTANLDLLAQEDVPHSCVGTLIFAQPTTIT